VSNFKYIWKASNGVREMEEYRFSFPRSSKYLLADFNPIFSQTLIYEGGYEAQSTDSGAFYNGILVGSNKGISANSLAKYLGRTPTVSDMKNLTDEQAEAIATAYYWNPIQGSKINSQQIASVLFDGIWASGGYGTKMMRQALNQAYGKTVADGSNMSMSLSDTEVDLINNAPDQTELFNDYMLLRKKFIQSIPGYSTYGTGWLNRLDSLYNKYIGTFEQGASKAVAFVKTNIVSIMVITFGVLATISIFAAVNAKDKPTPSPLPVPTT
jgi:lysozyme family protein